MLEVGWSEILVIAIILIVVVGPKDLPAMMRTFGKMMGRVRTMANEFRGQFDEAMREAELDDVRKGLSEVNKYNPANSLRDAMNPIRQLGNDIKSDLQKASTIPSSKAVDEGTPVDELLSDPVINPEPASAHAAPAEPAKLEPAPVAATPAKPMMTPAAAAPVATAAPAATVSEPVVEAKAAAKSTPRKKAAAPVADDYPPPAKKVVKRKAPEPHVEHAVKVVADAAKPTPRTARKAPAAAKSEPVAKAATAEATAVKAKAAPRKKTPKTGDA
ncbi:Sec-independent protein translocase protein TatB [Rhizobium sp.]